MRWLWHGGEGPMDIPDWAYPYLVIGLRADPDRLSLCKCIAQLDYLDHRPILAIRIFDPGSRQEAEIREFAALDRYPERILYEGHLDLESGKILFSPRDRSSRDDGRNEN